MPRFIQTIDSNGNKIINIPEINAGNQSSLNIVAGDTVSSSSDKFEADAATSIILSSEGTGEGKGIISVTAKQSVSASGEESTTMGLRSSTTNIYASTLNEESTIQNIATPALNINNGASATTLTSKSNITNIGTLENTGNVDVVGNTTLVGDHLSIKGSSSDAGTVVTSSSVTFNNAEEILNKGKLTIAGDKSGSVYSVGSIESYENITNTGTIENTGNVTVKDSTLKVEEGSKSISVTKNSIDSDTDVTLFKNQTVNSTGTEYTYNNGTTVNFEGATNLKGATTATANVTVDGANLTVTGNTTLTGNTEASGGTIVLGDDTHTTTIKGSALTVSSPETLKFSPSVKVSASTSGDNPLVIEPDKISRTGDKNNLSIEAPNTTITSTVKSLVKGAAVEVVDSTNSGGLISGVDSVGATTLFGNSSVGISSSVGNVSLSSKTSMDLTSEGSVSVKSTGTGADSSLNLGQAGNATNINGSKITLTHGSNNSVDVISKLVVKESASGNGVEITDSLIEGTKSDGLEVKSSTITVQGNTSMGIKSPSITVGPISGDSQVTINTTDKSLGVNNTTTSIITSETTSIDAKQINLITGAEGNTAVNGGLSVTGGETVDTLDATTSLMTPYGNITKLDSTTGNIATVNSDQANFANQIKINDLIIRYDSVAKALIFETETVKA